MNPDMTTEELALELEALRETPSEEFAGKLDARAAAGFPRGGSELLGGFGGADSLRRALREARNRGPRRALLPALSAVTAAIVVATAVIVSTEGDGSGSSSPQRDVVFGSAAKAGPRAPSGVSTLAGKAEQTQQGAFIPAPPSSIRPTAPGVRSRQVERSAEITLSADPDQVQDVSGKVIDVVGRYRGIVLSSSVRDGASGEAGASFELLIPSTRLSPALADLSSIAEVRSRSENTLDITAPYVSARERLRDARAEAEGLLRQLGEADTDSERASLKAQLQIVRGRIAAFRSQVDRLQRRSNFSRVSLDIVTGKGGAVPGSGSGDWTIGDALHDAGRVLAVAAGVALLGAALILPIGLLAGAAWGARRIYLRRVRAGALGV